MTRKAKTRDEAFYRRLVADYRRSGKSQRVFAAERGIPAGTLSHWCHKVRKLEAAASAKRRPGRPSRAERAPLPAEEEQLTQPFLPVRLVEPAAPAPRSGAGGYELVLGKGVLRLPAEFDPARVAALLRAAEVVC